jgi:hypothetical protein
MTGYPLEDILHIRALRESAAAREMMAARINRDSARRTEIQTRKELTEFHDWRLKEEKEIYRHILHRQIRISELELVKASIGSLREREIDLAQKNDEAVLYRIQMEKAFSDARERYFRSVREKQKIQLHREDFMGLVKKEKERQEDMEMEEFQRQHPDWNSETYHESS